MKANTGDEIHPRPSVEAKNIEAELSALSKLLHSTAFGDSPNESSAPVHLPLVLLLSCLLPRGTVGDDVLRVVCGAVSE